ncbi:MAG: GTPase [Microcoleaceae cyanobacterium]
MQVAFVGQYSSGKSTIISALTGKRDIKIDADITTDKTTIYDWNGIKLIDTPGLFTERKDHDKITYKTMIKADLLVFCLTYMLFDSVTVENFKKLAYEKGYRWKMMLSINKMSDEAGKEEQKIANYRHSLSEALKPFCIDDFPICFVDAKDYCDGVDESDDFLLEVSRFQSFIDSLNKFVQGRGSLTKFDTPVRIVLQLVAEAGLIIARNSTEDSAFFEVLYQLSRTVKKERDRLKVKVKNIVLEISNFISNKGNELAFVVGTEQDFKSLHEQVELDVRQQYENAEIKLQQVAEMAIFEMRVELEKVLNGNLVQALVISLDNQQNIPLFNMGDDINRECLKNQVGSLRKIAETAGIDVTNVSTQKSGFLRFWDAGNNFHRAIFGEDKSFGLRLKSWEVLGVSENIGNSARFFGDAVNLVSVGVDFGENDGQLEEQMADVRRDISSKFQAVAKFLETEIELQVFEFESIVFGEIERQISAARSQEEEIISTSNSLLKQLGDIRRSFERILNYVQKTVGKVGG